MAVKGKREIGIVDEAVLWNWVETWGMRMAVITFTVHTFKDRMYDEDYICRKQVCLRYAMG
jgi:hypothetical protein